MHKQMIDGSLSTRESRRKAKNRKKKPISEHTKRFRTLYAYDPNALNPLGGRGMRVPGGESPPAYMRSMASVGGLTRRAMKKRQRVDMSRMSATAMLPAWMQSGLAAFAKIAQAVQAKYEASKKRT